MIDWQKYKTSTEEQFGNKKPMALKIRQMILAALADNVLHPGTRLIESDLGSQLNVSRTPLREAMAGLKADGIITHDDDGIRIRQLNWRDISSLYEMRATLEGLAARLTTERASLAEKNVINAICAEEQAMIASQASPDQLAKINGRFHNSILSAAGNVFLVESYERLSRLLILLGITAYSLPDRVDEIRQEHVSVNDAIQSGHAHDAETAMARHLNKALEARLLLLGNYQNKEID